MMGALTTAMTPLQGSRSRPARKRGLLLRLLPALLAGLTLAGCSGSRELPNVVYLVASISNDQAIDAELLEEFRDRLDSLSTGYRQLHPATHFQFGIYPDEWILPAITRRTHAGLGPDLLFVNGQIAKRMLDRGLVDPFPTTDSLERLFNPIDLQRMRTSRGALAGLPVLIQSQVACFNRKRLPQPPSTLQELLSASAHGHNIGMSIDAISLFWTAGSMGAVQALNRTVAGEIPTPGERQQIVDWLRWLEEASNQQRLTFYPNQASVMTEFMAGRLDWITCSSVSLMRLRKSLGPDLGVSALPRGPGGPATPVNRLRVLALGHSSSQAGRDRAVAFSRYSVNPLAQRSLTLGSQTMVPANRFVKVPVQSSVMLQALSTSVADGRSSDVMADRLQDNDPRIQRAQGLITELVFGEVTPQGAADALLQLFRKQR